MLPGYLLRNRYRIEHRLAAGGFGETYIAIDEDYPNKRRVVVKHLKPQSNDPAVLETARRLFDIEGVTLANLGDETDRIPTLYAYFEEDREFYLVQEWIEGQTLTQELGTRKLSEAATLEVIREILAVLTEVHGKRIIHRDLKPDNIIRRSRDRHLVLIDFGAVKAVRQTTLMATNIAQSIGIGTEGYMPSEQARGYPTSASDIYAVGAIALQCLTGQPPSKLFDQYGLEWRWRHLCTVSDRVANILSKMVAERHLDRYPHAMTAIKAIDLLLAPVAPSPSIPTVQSQPTPVPPTRSYRPTPPKPSQPKIKAPAQAARSPVDTCIDLVIFVSRVVLGFTGLFILLVLFSRDPDPSFKPSAEEPLPTDISEAHNKSAKQKSDRGDYRGALADYDRAIGLKPNDSNLYNTRGLLKYEKFQNYQGALADYDQAIKIDPSAITYKNRGLLKDRRLQDHWGALADYNSAIELDSNDAVVYNHRGFLQHQKFKDRLEASIDYDSAIRLKPHYAIAYYNRSILNYYELSDPTGGINDMKQAALLYQKQGNKKNYRKAIAQLKKWGVTENITLDDPM